MSRLTQAWESAPRAMSKGDRPKASIQGVLSEGVLLEGVL